MNPWMTWKTPIITIMVRAKMIQPIQPVGSGTRCEDCRGTDEPTAEDVVSVMEAPSTVDQRDQRGHATWVRPHPERVTPREGRSSAGAPEPRQQLGLGVDVHLPEDGT